MNWNDVEKMVSQTEYRRHRLSFEEAMDKAVLVWMRCLKRYDESRGIPFNLYFRHCLHREIKRFRKWKEHELFPLDIRRIDPTDKRPGLHWDLSQWRLIRKKLKRSLWVILIGRMRGHTYAQIAANLGVSRQRVEQQFQVLQREMKRIHEKLVD